MRRCSFSYIELVGYFDLQEQRRGINLVRRARFLVFTCLL